MKYAYYPGCSLESSGLAYEESTQAVAKRMGMDLVELDDWNCCGATSYMSVKELTSMSISARNLSLAQKMGLDIVAPCAACFTNLRKTDHYLQEMPELRKKVAEVLAAADLSYQPGSVKVLHLLQAMIQEGGLERLKKEVKISLKGLKVAPYYGCQMVRPRVDFDDPEQPMLLDHVIGSLGARAVAFAAKTRCCGASLMASNEKVAIRLCKNILLATQQSGADCIVTVCPLCQMNLDGFQNKVNATYKTKFKIPVIYFTQLMGLAMGIPPKELGFGREIVTVMHIVDKYSTGNSAIQGG